MPLARSYAASYVTKQLARKRPFGNVKMYVASLHLGSDAAQFAAMSPSLQKAARNSKGVWRMCTHVLVILTAHCASVSFFVRTHAPTLHTSNSAHPHYTHPTARIHTTHNQQHDTTCVCNMIKLCAMINDSYRNNHIIIIPQPQAKASGRKSRSTFERVVTMQIEEYL